MNNQETVSPAGIAPGQPGIVFSYQFVAAAGMYGEFELQVFRAYPFGKAPASHGIQRLADYGKRFSEHSEMVRYALERGYLAVYVPRARRFKTAQPGSLREIDDRIATRAAADRDYWEWKYDV